MAKNKGNAFFIGLFVILGSLILIGVIIWLGATQFLQEQTYYVTYFDTSVEGLSKGTSVKYQGVPCGRITQINVAPDGRLIEVVMQIDSRIVINDSMRIKSELSGLAGGRFLQIFFPKPEIANITPEINFEVPYRLIKSSPSGFEEITLATQQVINNLLELDVYNISKGLVKFLDNSNKLISNKELYEIIRNLNESSKLLVSIAEKVDNSNVFSNTSTTSVLLLETAQNLQNMVDSLNNQIIMMDLPGLSQNITSKYDSLIFKTGSSISNIALRSESAIITAQETLEQLKLTNRNLQKTLRALSDNPSSIFLTEPPKKER